MSHPFPPNPPGYAPHPGGYQHPYAGHPAYAGYPGPAPRSGGLNPWVAGLLGFFGGGLLTAMLGVVLLFASGLPMPWEGPEDWVEDWTGSVAVATDGSVAGPVLADAVIAAGGGGFYEKAECLATQRVAQDVTTFCQVDDGYDSYRVVVVFLSRDGEFEIAELLSE